MDFSWEIYAKAEREHVASQLPGRQDDPADAYRHILAAAEAVRQGYPEAVVRSWGEWRERVTARAGTSGIAPRLEERVAGQCRIHSVIDSLNCPRLSTIRQKHRVND